MLWVWSNFVVLLKSYLAVQQTRLKLIMAIAGFAQLYHCVIVTLQYVGIDVKSHLEGTKLVKITSLSENQSFKVSWFVPLVPQSQVLLATKHLLATTSALISCVCLPYVRFKGVFRYFGLFFSNRYRMRKLFSVPWFCH